MAEKADDDEVELSKVKTEEDRTKVSRPAQSTAVGRRPSGSNFAGPAGGWLEF